MNAEILDLILNELRTRHINDDNATERLGTIESRRNLFRKNEQSRESEVTLEHFIEEFPVESVDHLINVRVSDAKLRDLKERTPLRRKLKKIFGIPEPMDYEEFDDQIKRLYKCCLKSVRDLHELHLRRSIGMDILEDIVLRASPDYINISHVIHLIWCVMSCIHHFQLRIRTSERGLISWARKRKSGRCLTVYHKLIRLLDQEMYRIAVNAIVTFYREGKLWEIEFACTDLIIDILELHPSVKEDLDDIVYTIENATLENPEEAKHLTKILGEIMKNMRFSKMTMYLVTSIMNMMESSIKPKPTDAYNYVCLKQGMELCIRHAIKNLKRRDLIKVLYILINKMNTNASHKELVLCFGNLAVYTAHNYNVRTGVYNSRPDKAINFGFLPNNYGVLLLCICRVAGFLICLQPT